MYGIFLLRPDNSSPTPGAPGFSREPEGGTTDTGAGKVLYHVYIFPGIDLLIGKKRSDGFCQVPYPKRRGCEKGGEIAIVIGFEICTRDPLVPATPDTMEKVGLAACFFVNGKRLVAFYTYNLPG